MNLKLKLLELKQVFELYEPFWKEWTTYKYCGLTEKDIYLIEAHKRSNYKLSIEDRLMFYYREATLTKVIEKLKKHYQDWAIMQFQFMVINLHGTSNFFTFLEAHIAQLPIKTQLVEILLRFKFNTLNELFATIPDKGFRDKDYFDLILLFKKRFDELNYKSNCSTAGLVRLGIQ